MRKHLRHAITVPIALLALQFVVPAFAQQGALELDPARTAVHFTLRTSLHTVHGTFQLKSGKASFDPLTGKASGLLVVDAASGQSGNSGRDSKMHREILESQKYSEITFTLTDVDGAVPMQGDLPVQVKGTFRLHGQDHQMIIPVDVRISGSDLTLDTNFSVPYISWGLKNPSTFILRASDTVQVSVHAVGQWTREATNE
jgi:polyisoprenoid-binding protein YceI